MDMKVKQGLNRAKYLIINFVFIAEIIVIGAILSIVASKQDDIYFYIAEAVYIGYIAYMVYYNYKNGWFKKKPKENSIK
jgi:hypothetical protein